MDITSYVMLNRKILKLVGLYPKNGARCFTAVFFMLLIVVPQVLQIYHSTDLDVILETSSVLLTIMLAILKMIVWNVNRNDIADLITYLFGDYWKIINADKMEPRFLQYAVLSKTFTKCYILLVTNALALFYGLPLIQTLISNSKSSVLETGVFLFPGWYPEGCKQSPFYEITLVSQILATSTCGVVILAIDTLIATALFHTCGHFKILQKNLRSLGDVVNQIENLIEDRGNEESLKILVRHKLGIHIAHHQVVLRFSETLEYLFNPIMLCQLLASIMIICLVGVQPVADRDKLLKYMSYLLMALFQLILFCLPGDDLINQSLAVSDAAYDTNWCKISKLLDADVKFIIARGQRSVKITAGKFTVMCLEHFGTVLRTSMSCFTVLRSLS